MFTTLVMLASAAIACVSIFGWFLSTRAPRGGDAGVAAERDRLQKELAGEQQARAAAETRAARVPELEAAVERLTAGASSLKAENAALAARAVEERKSAAEKLALLDDAQARLADAFKALSGEALKSNNQAFLDLAKGEMEKLRQGANSDLEARQKAIDALLKPIGETLTTVQKSVHDLEVKREGAYKELLGQVENMRKSQADLKTEAANLVKALRAPQVRGRWGEIQLRNVAEMAGMLEYCDFTQQETANTEDGRLRPDMIVKLPGGKQIVVDAKTPLVSYLDAVDAPDDATREQNLKDHARRVREHMTELGRKSYWSQFEQAPDFVVMFLPGEMFFSAALQQDPGLIEFGVKEKVIVASPTTLISLLRAVGYGWQQERVAESAQQISDLGRELYKRLGDFAGHFESMGKSLGRTVASYNAAVGSFDLRLLPSARRFRELGSTQDEELRGPAPVELGTREMQAPELTESRAGDAGKAPALPDSHEAYAPGEQARLGLD